MRYVQDKKVEEAQKVTENPILGPAAYITPLYVNGLRGRMLQAPANGRWQREILLVYGHHAKLERWWGLVENLCDYGNVTMPDLPGFGGMQNFHKVKQQPTIDNFADYLAAFIRLKYKNKRFTVFGISFGFAVVTRMLQRYPELAKNVDLSVSLVGFMHRDDFYFKPHTRQRFKMFSRFLGMRPVAWIFRYVGLNGPAIRFVYARLPAGKRRLSSMDPIEAREMLDYDIKLWHANDMSTHWRTTAEFLDMDNCNKTVDLPSWHVASKNDPYLNSTTVKQHMLAVFNSCHQGLIMTRGHTPNLIADKAELAVLLPAELRKELTNNA
jgi:pimeloyl-ACP methyl ester carboxylesterase